MDSIGQYEVLGELGAGGLGVVYKARDPFLKRFVAIKTCPLRMPEIRDRFFREAEVAGRLDHPNITRVFSFGFHGEVPYLVQEYLGGEDLERTIERRAPLPAAERVEILRQVARGLEAAHQEGVIHRDVKPANLRLLDDGRVKIMDFGIAKLAEADRQLTATGMALGTVHYLQPEQIRGEPLDERADVYSFGVVAYELLTYRLPFEGKTAAAVFYRIVSETPAPVAELWPECPARLADLVARCLAKEPRRRPPGFAEVAAELEAVLAGLRAAKLRLAAPTVPMPRRAREEPDDGGPKAKAALLLRREEERRAREVGEAAIEVATRLQLGELEPAEEALLRAESSFGRLEPFRLLRRRLENARHEAGELGGERGDEL
ncbi:MAG TPA: serine/threonine-protein kinase [Thermoanaerobaculia bacterium]|nr:serine/threonine-protein kinase [Thermoanaerobaculia bacterium]